MQDAYAPDAGRPTVVSAKFPADVVAMIDRSAVLRIMTRAAWIKEAAMEKLTREAEAAGRSARANGAVVAS